MRTRKKMIGVACEEFIYAGPRAERDERETVIEEYGKIIKDLIDNAIVYHVFAPKIEGAKGWTEEEVEQLFLLKEDLFGELSQEDYDGTKPNAPLKLGTKIKTPKKDALGNKTNDFDLGCVKYVDIIGVAEVDNSFIYYYEFEDEYDNLIRSWTFPGEEIILYHDPLL